MNLTAYQHDDFVKIFLNGKWLGTVHEVGEKFATMDQHSKKKDYEAILAGKFHTVGSIADAVLAIISNTVDINDANFDEIDEFVGQFVEDDFDAQMELANHHAH
jgi:hypothetical protein